MSSIDGFLALCARSDYKGLAINEFKVSGDTMSMIVTVYYGDELGEVWELSAKFMGDYLLRQEYGKGRKVALKAPETATTANPNILIMGKSYINAVGRFEGRKIEELDFSPSLL